MDDLPLLTACTPACLWLPALTLCAAHCWLPQLLAVAPPESVRLLLTAAAPVDLPGGRAVECYWLGGLPETAAVALVQETAKYVSLLFSACLLPPVAVLCCSLLFLVRERATMCRKQPRARCLF